MDVQQCHVDVLSCPGALALCQRRLDRHDAIDAREDIRERHANFLRLTGRIARQIHDAAHALYHRIVTGALGIGPGLPEARDGAIHQAWVRHGTRGIVEPIFFQAAAFEVLDDHVGAVDQSAHESQVGGRTEIRDHRSLAAVTAMKVGGIRVAAIGVLDERRTPAARVIAVR